MIQVYFSLEARDLFRASMDLAKFRLLLGLLFTLCIVSGLVMFFIMLDEKLILLETSPFFVGLPLLSVGGQVLRIHAACRKYVARLTDSQRRMQFTFCEETDGYDVACGDSFGHVSWKDIFKVVEKQQYFHFFISKYEARIIPKRGFHQAADVDLLRNMLASKLGSKAKFLRS
jgi:YcxB-like protein